MEYLTTYFPQVSKEELELICRRYHIKSLSLFGSMLHKDEHNDSDLDLLVEFETGHTPGFTFAQIQAELAQLFGRTVDLHTRYSLSKYFKETVVKEAASIYSNP
jgi:hypothetical protein